MAKKQINQDIVFYAFRYCLGRRTGAVGQTVDYLKENWKDLPEYTQNQIQKEIKLAIRQRNAGSDCDIKQWERLLNI